MTKFIRIVRGVDRGMAAAESAMLVVVMTVMVLLAVTQVLFKIAHSGVEQVEMTARYLVIWVAFLGGSVASHQGRHINIDLFSRFVGPMGRRIAGVLVNAIATALIVVMLSVACSYVSDMMQEGRVAVEFPLFGTTWNLKGWWFASILPLGLALMGCHFLILAILNACGAVEGQGETLLAVDADDGKGGVS